VSFALSIMAQDAAHDEGLRLPPTTSSSGTPLTAEMARANQVFIETFNNDPRLQEYNDFQCVPRPASITAGKPAQIALNSHKVKSFPTKTIYQYDVSLDPCATWKPH